MLQKTIKMAIPNHIIKSVNREFRIRVYFTDGKHGLKGAGMIEPILGEKLTLSVFNKALDCSTDIYTYKQRNGVLIKFLSK
jgi:hypothetical protein